VEISVSIRSYIHTLKSWGRLFKGVSYAQQGCICLNKKALKLILWNIYLIIIIIKKSIWIFFWKIIYPC